MIVVVGKENLNFLQIVNNVLYMYYNIYVYNFKLIFIKFKMNKSSLIII